MSKEIFVAFATQKGGIGKSTVTALAASYLHNVKGYNVAVGAGRLQRAPSGVDLSLPSGPSSGDGRDE